MSDRAVRPRGAFRPGVPMMACEGSHDKRSSGRRREAPCGWGARWRRLRVVRRRSAARLGGPHGSSLPAHARSLGRALALRGCGRAGGRVAATYSAPLDRAIADLTVRRRGADRLHPRPLPALGRRRRRRVQHPRRGADRGGRRPGDRQGRLRAERRPLVLATTTGCPGPTPAASTSTTWCRSPRPGTRGRGAGRGAPGRPTPTTSGTARSLVGVTDSVNQSKGDQDPAEWMPEYANCRYVREWVAVKHRWRLNVDRAEKRALARSRRDCANRTITVTLAR